MMDVCVGARNEHLRLYSTQTLRAHGRCLSRRFYFIISVLSFLLLMNCSSAFQVRILKRRPTSSLFLRPNKPSKPTDIDEDFLGLDVDNDNENSGESRRQSLSQNRPVLLDAKGKFTMLNKAILAGIFVAGIGTGINLDSAINTNPKDLASRDAIDRNAPNPKLCARFGSSAMVMDQRLFVTFNPFNVYVTQADTKPGCVLRPANVVPLLQQERQLLTNEQVESCKNGFNTWAFVGDINNNPQLTCVFQSDDAQNEFLSNPKVGLGEDVYDNRPQRASLDPSSTAGASGAGAGASSSVAPPAALKN